MFAIILLLSAFSSSLSSPIEVPRAASEHVPLEIFGHTLPRALDVARFRTKQDIIWSCLATIFACTWVAVHPNLPGPGDSGWTRFKRQTTTMVYAMIAPEFVTAWAMMQWIAARAAVREFNKTPEENVPWYMCVLNFPKDCGIGIRVAVKGWFDDPRNHSSNEWTLTHGFMIQMGGFILYDGETPKRALTFEELKRRMEKGEVEPPRVSEHEINDKSKGDFLTKLVVVLQTSWFVFQCLARWIQGLPITELEVVTLAFSLLNVITYGLWWKKPQNILVAIPVQLKNPSGRIEESATKPGSIDTEVKDKWIIRKLRAEVDGGIGWVFVLPYRLIQAALRPLSKMQGGYSAILQHNSLRVPMFFSGGLGELEVIPFIAITLLFGGLHLIPWSYTFPSTAELWLWRLCAIFITALPLLLAVALILDAINDRYNDRLSEVLLMAVGYPSYLGIPLYVIARLILLVLAFVTLRAPPAQWDIAVEWTTFLPHA